MPAAPVLVAQLAAHSAALVAWVAAGSFAWPGAAATDGRALAGLPDSERPAAIAELVAREGLGGARPYLLPLLGDPDLGTRLEVGRLLAHAGDPAAVEAATHWVTGPSAPAGERTLALGVLALAPSLTPEARRVIALAAGDPDPGTRLMALEALARQPIGPSLDPVLRALDDDSREVRLRAIRLAGNSAESRATLALLRRLEDPDPQLRIEAARALGRLRDPRAIPALLRSTGAGTLAVRAAAIDALGELKADAATAALLALARREPVAELGRQADLALGAIATPPAIAALVAALRSPLAPEEVTAGLRRAGPAAVLALGAELGRSLPSSATAAAQILGRIGDRRAVEPLAAAIDRALGAPDAAATWRTVALASLEALARLGDPAAVPALVRASESPDAEIRQRAFAALLALADPRAIAVVDPGLGDPSPGIRALAADIAGALDADAAAAGLVARLGDSAIEVRVAAARALGQTRGPSSRLLAGVLEAMAAKAPSAHPDQVERAAIGDALEHLATGTDVDRLVRALDATPDERRDPLARGLAAALGGRRLADGAVVDRLIATVADGGPAAGSAADALGTAVVAPRTATALWRAFAGSEPSVRARLCPALGALPDGGAWLAAVLASPDESIEVRAAAAWAGRTSPEARAALEAAARSQDGGPVAANARAALAAGARPFTGWAAARLRGPDGLPLAGRWVTFDAGGDLLVQALTDGEGLARVTGLPAGAIAVRAPGLSLGPARAAP